MAINHLIFIHYLMCYIQVHSHVFPTKLRSIFSATILHHLFFLLHCKWFSSFFFCSQFSRSMIAIKRNANINIPVKCTKFTRKLCLFASYSGKFTTGFLCFFIRCDKFKPSFNFTCLSISQQIYNKKTLEFVSE